MTMNKTTTRQQQNNKLNLNFEFEICCFVVVLLLSYSLKTQEFSSFFMFLFGWLQFLNALSYRCEI